MEFYDVVKTRRSIRSYRAEKVPEDVIRRVLDAARVAPSANNVQPWSFIVVQDEKTREKIARLSSNQMFVAQAPATVVCCGEKYRDPYSWIGDNMYFIDVSISIDHLTLAARNEGLGTCWIGAFDHRGLKALLDIPERVDVIALTPLGYPKSRGAFSARAWRKDLSEIAFRESYGRKL